MKLIPETVYPELSCNCYWQDGLAIDCGPRASFPREPELVLLTHGHYDHCGGVKGKALLHEGDWNVKRLNEAFWDFERPPSIGPLKQKQVEWNGFSLKVIETPGHTPGSVCFFDEENKTLYSGDTLFAEGVGRTDLWGGDEEALAKSLKLIDSLDWETLCPGHGPVKRR